MEQFAVINDCRTNCLAVIDAQATEVAPLCGGCVGSVAPWKRYVG